ncbi:TnsA endonuclease N-terminal domain-containing protein [Cupriavidus necator]
MNALLPPCPPRYPCLLEPDELGVPSGTEYEPFMRAVGKAKGTDYSFTSEKTGRAIQCLSMGERATAMLLEVNPWVVDYREQYVRASDELLAAIIENPTEPVLRNKVFTFDFVVTYQTRHSMEFEYEVLSVKETHADTKRKEVQRRFEREQDDASSRNWAWRSIVKEELNTTAVLAAARLIRWGGAFTYRDRQDGAMRLASVVQELNTGQVLDELLDSAARKLRITIDDAYQYFTMAVCFGFLAADLKMGLGTRMPVFLREA